MDAPRKAFKKTRDGIAITGAGLLLVGALILAGCGSSGSSAGPTGLDTTPTTTPATQWTHAEEQAVRNGMESGGATPGPAFESCVLSKVEAEYPNPSDLLTGTQTLINDVGTRAGADCASVYGQ